ncbi:MAG: glycosyltransferase family 2 protein, partial [Sphingobacteriales bacterium]
LKTDYFYYSEAADSLLHTFYLSGANALIDAKKLKSIGGFYELFSPFYCEDMELSMRAWRLNWKCYYEHQSVCRHQVSASTKNYKTAKWVKSIYYRNRFYMHALHLNGFARIAWFLQITLIDLLPKLLIGQWWLWHSYIDLLSNRKLIAGYRERLKELMEVHGSSRTISDVIADLRGSIDSVNVKRFKP